MARRPSKCMRLLAACYPPKLPPRQSRDRLTGWVRESSWWLRLPSPIPHSPSPSPRALFFWRFAFCHALAVVFAVDTTINSYGGVLGCCCCCAMEWGVVVVFLFGRLPTTHVRRRVSSRMVYFFPFFFLYSRIESFSTVTIIILGVMGKLKLSYWLVGRQGRRSISQKNYHHNNSDAITQPLTPHNIMFQHAVLFCGSGGDTPIIAVYLTMGKINENRWKTIRPHVMALILRLFLQGGGGGEKGSRGWDDSKGMLARIIVRFSTYLCTYILGSWELFRYFLLSLLLQYCRQGFLLGLENTNFSGRRYFFFFFLWWWRREEKSWCLQERSEEDMV